MICEDCIHAAICGLRDQLGEYAEHCDNFFKKIPTPHGRLIDVEVAETAYPVLDVQLAIIPTVVEAEGE